MNLWRLHTTFLPFFAGSSLSQIVWINEWMAYKNVNMHKWKLHFTANRCDKIKEGKRKNNRKKRHDGFLSSMKLTFFSVCAKKIPRVLTTKHECRKSFCLFSLLACFWVKQVHIFLSSWFLSEKVQKWAYLGLSLNFLSNSLNFASIS